MSFKRILAVLVVGIGVAGSGAFAIAQTQSDSGETKKDESERSLGLDPSRDYPESFLRTAEHYNKQFPDAEPGLNVGDDEVGIPAVSPAEIHVRQCAEVASTDPTLETDSVCRAILLMDAGAIEPGVYKIADVKQRYLDFIRSE